MGRTTSYAYYDDDRLQSVTIGAGTQNAVVAQSLTYDAAGNLISRCEGWTATDGCASQTDYTVDGADRVTQVVVDPNGLDRVITHTFDADNNILTETRTGGGLARNLDDRKNDDRFAWDKLPSNIGQFGKKVAWGCLGIPAPIATCLPVCFTAS